MIICFCPHNINTHLDQKQEMSFLKSTATILLSPIITNNLYLRKQHVYSLPLPMKICSTLPQHHHSSLSKLNPMLHCSQQTSRRLLSKYSYIKRPFLYATTPSCMLTHVVCSKDSFLSNRVILGLKPLCVCVCVVNTKQVIATPMPLLT